MRNLYYFLIFVLIILSGCKYKQYPKNIIKQNYDLNSEQKKVTSEPYNKKVQENIIDKEKEGGIGYVNNELGFGITFPSHWDGYYKLIDIEGGISINFYGKSLAGKGATNLVKNGLPIFFILNEKIVEYESLDGVKKIGKAKNINYYFATGAGVDLEPIMLIDDDTLRWHKEIYGEEIYAEDEITMINQDWEKAQKMLKDVSGIIETFYALD